MGTAVILGPVPDTRLRIDTVSTYAPLRERWRVRRGQGRPLVAVRVLDCAGSGATSGVIAGVDWVTANRVRPAVANMSLGGGASSALDTAVNNSHQRRA